MADDSNKSSDPGSQPASEKGQASVNLSIEEKGMLVMPVTPDPKGNVEIGGLPINQGGGEGGSGGSDGGGGSSSSSDSGE